MKKEIDLESPEKLYFTQLARQVGYMQRNVNYMDAYDVMMCFREELMRELIDGKEIVISGLGKFYPHISRRTKYYSAAEDKPITVKPRVTVKFRISKSLRNKIGENCIPEGDENADSE